LYQSSYRSSTLRVPSSFRRLLYRDILSPHFYVSVILAIRSSSSFSSRVLRRLSRRLLFRRPWDTSFTSFRLFLPLFFGIGLRLLFSRLVDTSPVLRRFSLIFILSSSFGIPTSRLPSLCCLFSSSMVQPVSSILILIGLGFRLFSPIDYLGSTRHPRFIHLRSYALRVVFLPSFHSSFHLVLLLRHPSVHDSIVLRSWPSWVCRVSYAHGGCDVYSTLASSILFSGCATYPMLVVGVTCTLSSRSFYSVRLVTSRPSSMFRSPSLSCFCNFRAPSFFPVNRLPSSSSSSSMSPRLRHCPSCSSPDPRSHPLSGFMAPLWILGLLFRLRLRYLLCFLSASCSGATWFSLVITVYSHLSISFFAFDIRCPCSPTCFFRS
jgi:hypothetical protein